MMKQVFRMTSIIVCYMIGSVAYSDEGALRQNDIIEKHIFGRYEKVIFPDLNNIKMSAKLDTGALTSSLGATDVEIFKKSGKRWVRFRVLRDEKQTVYEFPIKRISKIKRRVDDVSSDEDSLHTKRPVIEIPVCLGDKKEMIEVNLSDRSNFQYNFLMGSNALIKFGAVVDPSEKFQAKNKCQQ